MLPVAPPVEGRTWLTTSPIDWSDLRGRVVVAAFWSFACEASLLALRQLEALSYEWGEEAVVLAVHTPRFPYEDDIGRTAAAVARHRIGLPVVHDPDYLTWNRYNPEGWPATAVINRRGRVVGITAGTGGIDVVDQAVRTALAERGRRSGAPGSGGATSGGRSSDDDNGGTEPVGDPPAADEAIDRVATGPRPLRSDPADGSTLSFPAAVAVNNAGRLAIADTGHDRLLIGPLDTDLRTVRPEVELTDIVQPRAVAWASDSVIYVVDGGTDCVLQIDLDHGTLDVLADDELSAPTALLVDGDGSVVVADAGHDQLLRIASDAEGEIIVGPIAGSGFTGCRDGNAGQAELAQPVALTRTTSGIAFCDAASSNVRLLTDEGRIRTVTGNDFFDWGLVDGPAHRARFQRPSGMCTTADGSLVIVDTGNDRLRSLADRRVRTMGLSGLDQPVGIAALDSGHLVVADTGNHRIVVADPELKTGWPLAVYPAAMTSVWA